MEPAVVLQNEYAKVTLEATGHVLEFSDVRTGIDYCGAGEDSTFARVRTKAGELAVSGLSREGDRLILTFPEGDIQVALSVRVEPHYFLFEVSGVQGDNIEELSFLDVGLAVEGQPSEPFAGCVLALNLQTNVREIPGPNQRLRALCYPRFGFEGAEAALIACPMERLRDTMKEVVRSAEALPQFEQPIGGPWALDASINRGSYLFDFGKLTEETVGDWIALAKELGISQIDFHIGHSMRFGDCRPNPELFPRGRASVKAVIDELHAAGLVAGLHTYAFFVAKETPWVTPRPDARLAKDATFTLSEALSAEATSVPVDEPTEAMSTTMGFHVRNSVTLQIEDELITYSGISKSPPYAFTECSRGACGTAVSPHPKGAAVYHLKECFGLFTPDGDSTLLEEVAARTAETFNECGFDMIYLDALDGEDVLGGRESGWHYGSKFVFELCKRLEKAPLMEISTFHHHLWYVRARMGAWDHPNRSHKRFIDVHGAANDAGRSMFLPMHLGWWAVKARHEGALATQVEPTFPDDIEYLMCKCLGNGEGFSLMGVDPDTIGTVPAYKRLAPIFRRYEELRHAGHFPESVKAQLRVPGDEFTLEDAADAPRLRRVQYDRHKVQGIDGWSNVWTYANQFGRQPVRLRIEALSAAAPYDSPDAVVLTDFTDPDEFAERTRQDGVDVDLQTSTSHVKEGGTSGEFSAASSRMERKGAWGMVRRVFSPDLDIAERQALGLWVHGDGQGALLNVQLLSPPHIIHGIGDHYVPIDFTGWRYVELIEPEGGRIAEYEWPYGGAYAVYREWVDYGHVRSLSLWYNHLPPGKEITTYLSPIKALPVVDTTLRNPRVSVNGTTMTFPVAMDSGSYLEFQGLDDCTLYGSDGSVLATIVPEGETPVVAAGENTVEFSAEAAEGISVRAHVTVISLGEVIE